MPKKLSTYVPALKWGAVIDAKMPISGTRLPLSYYEYYTSPILTASSASQPLFTVPSDGCTWQICAVSTRFTTASSSGTLQVEIAGAGIAVGSGTNQLSSTISLAGTANTTVNGTVIASPTTVAAGSSVNLVLAGTLTSLAGCLVTVVLQRIS